MRYASEAIDDAEEDEYLLEDPFPDDEDEGPLLHGWGHKDLERLERLADLGMDFCEDLKAELSEHRAAVARGEAKPMSAAEVDRAALGFSRTARSVRMTLTLKARIRSEVPMWAPPKGCLPYDPAHPWGSPMANADYDRRVGFPGHPAAVPDGPPEEAAAIVSRYPLGDGPEDPNDPEERALWQAAEVRLAFNHALTGLERLEAESRSEVLEGALEREREREDFWRMPSATLALKLCETLKLQPQLRAGLDGAGLFRAWIVARPDEPSGPVTFEGEAPHATQFMTPGSTLKPGPSRPPRNIDAGGSDARVHPPP